MSKDGNEFKKVTSKQVDGTLLEVIVGDITKLDVDAIVNAANNSLMGGGGVDGAIHRAGGPSIMAECLELRRTKLKGGLITGNAVRTGAGNLPARHVIHTVGPVYPAYSPEGAERLLAECYSNCMAIAQDMKSIAFPSISTGAYAYPIQKAAEVAVETVGKAVRAGTKVERVVFCAFFDSDGEVYGKALENLG